MTNAKELINQSARTSSIVVVACTPELRNELQAVCEDVGNSDTAVEFWGTDQDGDEWRVHLAL